MAVKVSRYLTLDDAFRSRTANALKIKNSTADPTIIENIKHVAVNVFDKVKDEFPNAFLNSFFRSRVLNNHIGGANTSQHLLGEALDIDSKEDNAKIFEYIKENLQFDQLIWEKGNSAEPAWVHVSLKRIGKNRKQIITVK